MRTLILASLLVLAACGSTSRTTARIQRSPEGTNLHILMVTDPNIGRTGSVLGVFRGEEMVGVYRVDRHEGHTLLGSLVAGSFGTEGRLELRRVTEEEIDALVTAEDV